MSAAGQERCGAGGPGGLAGARPHADTDDLVEAITKKGAKPCIYIESAGALVVPLQCRHCEDAPCMVVCPSGALLRPDEEGPVLVDQAKCIGCAFCVQACPFGVIRLAHGSGAAASDKQMAGIKCDLCADRQAEGLEPACVNSCPVRALMFVEGGDSAKMARIRAAAQAAAVVITGRGR